MTSDIYDIYIRNYYGDYKVSVGRRLFELAWE